MKTLLLGGALVMLSGCADMTLTKTAPDGTVVKFHAVTCFSNSAIKGLAVDSATKTTTNALRVTSTASEPNSESITATADAIGNLIGTAVKAAATK